MSETKAPDPAGKPPDRRKLIAVLHADVVGYSRLIGLDDVGTLGRLRTLRSTLIDPAIEEHGGRIVNTGGDSLLIVFDSIDGAVRCAVKVQQQVPVFDSDQSPDRTIRFRVGINVGDVIPDGSDVHGDVVNVAARLQAECPPGGICVSRAVREHLRNRVDLDFEELGALKLKNIAHPVEAFALRLDGDPTTTRSVVRSVVRDIEALPLPDRPSIVILPFQNMSSESEQDYFADGMVHDITTAVSRFHSLFVIACNSAFTYKGRAIDIREVGRQLGVRYVVEGSVRKAGNNIRIACRLIQAENGVHLWAEHYDRDFKDVFALQDEITAHIVSTLIPTFLRVEIERALRKPADNLDAYDLYLRALAGHRRLTREGNEEARRFVGQILTMEPHSVPALVLGDACWSTALTNGWASQAEAFERSSRYARLAVNLAPDDADALSALAQRTAAINGDYEDAVSLASRAMAANPNSASVLNRCGFALLYANHADEALALFERALRLNPRDPTAWGIWNGVGFTLIELGRDAEAIDAGKKAAQLNPASADAFRVLAASHALVGRLDEAKAAVQRMLELDPGCTINNIRARYGLTGDGRAFDGFRKAGLPE